MNDRDALPYVWAFILETQRWRPVAGSGKGHDDIERVDLIEHGG